MIIEEKKTKRFEEPCQKVMLENRKRLSLNGVQDVGTFSEHSVVLETNMGRLLIRGENLHIAKIDIDGGDFAVDGKINSLEYLKRPGKKGGFFENIFK